LQKDSPGLHAASLDDWHKAVREQLAPALGAAAGYEHHDLIQHFTTTGHHQQQLQAQQAHVVKHEK